MSPNKTYSQYTPQELDFGFRYMVKELTDANAPDWLWKLWLMVWNDFKKEGFSYDGATFSAERSKETLFEVGAFLHDWLNDLGIVSYTADAFMFRVMILLNYRWNLIVGRWIKTRLTFINIIRHRYKGTYKGKFPVELI